MSVFLWPEPHSEFIIPVHTHLSICSHWGQELGSSQIPLLAPVGLCSPKGEQPVLEHHRQQGGKKGQEWAGMALEKGTGIGWNGPKKGQESARMALEKGTRMSRNGPGKRDRN